MNETGILAYAIGFGGCVGVVLFLAIFFRRRSRSVHGLEQYELVRSILDKAYRLINEITYVNNARTTWFSVNGNAVTEPDFSLSYHPDKGLQVDLRREDAELKSKLKTLLGQNFAIQ